MAIYYFENQIDFADHYRTLGLPFNASYEEIKKAHRNLVKQMHPDTLTNDYYGDYEEFVKVDEAYKTLSHPEAKEHYDFLYRKYILQEPYLKPMEEGDSCGPNGCRTNTCGPNPDNATSGTRFLSFIIIIAMVFAFLLRGLI